MKTYHFTCGWSEMMRSYPLMYETDNQNHKFAQQFTQAVNEERKAEAGNRGEANPPKYRLVGGIGNVWAGIAHWQAVKKALRGE